MFESWARPLGDQRGGLCVGEVAVGAYDSLFERPRVAAFEEAFFVMVELDECQVGFAQKTLQHVGGAPEVGQYCGPNGAHAHRICDRVGGVMRHSDGFDGVASDLKQHPRSHLFDEGGAGLGSDPLPSPARHPERDRGPLNFLNFTLQHSSAGDVVSVFVGDHDAVDVCTAQPGLPHTEEDLFGAEPAVDQDSTGGCTYVGAVATGARPEGGHDDVVVEEGVHGKNPTERGARVVTVGSDERQGRLGIRHSALPRLGRVG